MFNDFIARLALESLWALAWHYLIMVVLLACAVLWVMYIPILKKLAMLVAMCLVVCLIVAMIYTKLGARYVQAKWNAANAVDVSEALKAREAAEAYFPPAISGVPAKRLWNDTRDRDNIPAATVPGHGATFRSRLEGIQTHHLFQFKGHGGNSTPSPRS